MQLVALDGAYAGVAREYLSHVGRALVAQGRACTPEEYETAQRTGVARGSTAGAEASGEARDVPATPPTPKRGRRA